MTACVKVYDSARCTKLYGTRRPAYLFMWRQTGQLIRDMLITKMILLTYSIIECVTSRVKITYSTAGYTLSLYGTRGPTHL